MEKDPTHGIGKPEALKYNLSGYWYRRIDWENRIVYKVDGDIIWVISLRGHYKQSRETPYKTAFHIYFGIVTSRTVNDVNANRKRIALSMKVNEPREQPKHQPKPVMEKKAQNQPETDMAVKLAALKSKFK